MRFSMSDSPLNVRSVVLVHDAGDIPRLQHRRDGATLFTVRDTPTNRLRASQWRRRGSQPPAPGPLCLRLLRLLAWIGLTRCASDGRWFVPFRAPGRHNWASYNGRRWAGWRAMARATHWKPYAFRNQNCNPWWHNDRGHKRLLPFRWGFGWAGFEFGDRGDAHYEMLP